MMKNVQIKRIILIRRQIQIIKRKKNSKIYLHNKNLQKQNKNQKLMKMRNKYKRCKEQDNNLE